MVLAIGPPRDFPKRGSGARQLRPIGNVTYGPRTGPGARGEPVAREKNESNNETLNEMREENRAPVEKVEENNRQLTALREELARRP